MAANERLSTERAHFKASLSTALKDDDDPLAAYDQFVKWTVKNYADDDPSSGLRELLQEATAAFKSDPVYKTDLRYLKLWILYIRQLTRVDAVATFAFLLANGIGASYSILYEEYAAILELDGRHAEAKTVYQKGIKRQVRPLERLKSRYHEFKGRLAASPDPNTTPTQVAQRASVASPSSLVTNASLATTAESRYAHIFAPPLPGKRPEKPQFDLSLLFSDKEYCIEEARARSIGLYGKKWPAPPPPAPFSTLGNSAVSSSSSMSSVKVNFNDDGQGSSRMGAGRRRSMMGGAEPTVTINTKEALADVFGMFNSPEKTAKLAAIVQHKKIEPATPIAPPPRRPANENENSYAKTPQPGFRPFVDENAGANISRKENTPAKHFVPFVDPETIKTPFSAPRVALSQKETPTPVGNPRTNPSKITVNKLSVVPEDANRPAVQERNVFKVFTPAIPADQPKPTPLPLRDVFTDDHGKPQPKPKHERAKSYHDSATPAPSFKPFVDENSGIRTPFKVFSRPPEEGENAVTPGNNPVFTPFKDAPKATPSAFTPFEDVEEEPKAPSPPPRTPSWGDTVIEIPDDEEEELEQYADDFQYDDDDDNGVGEYLPLGQEQEVYEDTDDSYQVPLGGRFGQFNVMTPITERTFEFTSTTARSSTFGGTPSRVLGQVDEDAEVSWHDEHHAAAAAERLVAELQEDDDEEEEPLQQQTSGAFRLVDTLNLTSNFKPSNPCNPFDREVISALLARVVPDQFLYDLRDHDADMLDSLQKFAKRARKTSGNTSNNTGLLDGGWFPLNVGGHRFSVCEKLGEGGFGAVFKAKDLGTRQREDDDTDDEEDDDDDDGSSMVALKVVKPRNLWEYRVLRRLHSALPSHLRRSVVVPHALFAFRDESYLVMDLSPQGTLLNIVNGANSASLAQAGGTLDELLVMFFAVELLRVVEAMHSAGFIHGDLKIDNCLLRLEDVPGGPTAWSATYNPTGEDGWSYKGITLIDFGRTIDTRLFPSGQQFIADWDTDARDCFELREQRPWTYQIDYFGLAGIIYCLLFGKYIQANSVSTRDGRHKIDTPLKRYWQTEIWDRLFGILLNPCSVREDGSLPLPDELAEVRGQMEAWLQAHCNRTSNTLKGLLKKVQMLCI
ncbi:hypothetical protein DFH08DRAFT_730369 [Mycena albidolilacea]|uniref:Uncharacterized protein n=1 Tax=Mycena albidolilacea TaxID=1033008 RepID=A0AAD7ANJ8_9AGAR|nr:hypothetical protein DFH08DRAFT_730369 [Mycena albidolilacea]